jgi:hypothetical protein
MALVKRSAYGDDESNMKMPKSKRVAKIDDDDSVRLANVARLINNPFVHMMRVTEKGMLQFRSDEQGRWTSLGGIIEAIQQTFFPQYDYRKASNAAKKLKWVPNKRPAPPNRSFVSFKQAIGLDGRELGEHIDKEFAATVEHMVINAIPFVPKSFARIQVCPYTMSLLDFHHRNHWQPLFTQYKVMAPGLRVGTRIDEICITPDGRLIVVEIKYGYDEYREFGNACMNAPLGDCLDSPQHQHMLQCGIPALMLQKFWRVKIDAAFVVYVTDGEVYPLPVGAWFWERQEQIWNAFEEQMKKRIV